MTVPGLSLFLGSQQRSAAVGGSLHLAAATAPVRRLVALTGRRDFLPRGVLARSLPSACATSVPCA
jgi:hypothetical protein